MGSETSQSQLERRQRWTTIDEKQFIDGLGTHALNVGDSSFSPKDVDLAERANLLIKYAKSMSIRTEWGEVNKVEISKYIREKINALREQIQQATIKALEQTETSIN